MSYIAAATTIVYNRMEKLCRAAPANLETGRIRTDGKFSVNLMLDPLESTAFEPLIGDMRRRLLPLRSSLSFESSENL